MILQWKNNQFINYGNRISTKTLKYIGEVFVKFSTWKFNYIISSMRNSYNTGLKLHKQEIIQNLYNQMNFNFSIVLIILNNNNSTQVMKKKTPNKVYECI